MYALMKLVKIFVRIDHKMDMMLDIMNMHVVREQENKNSPTWLDNQDVMQKLNISASTLKRRRQEGVLPCTRLKGKYFYKESDIQAALGKGPKFEA